MKSLLIIIFLLISSLNFAQSKTNYRFSFGFSGVSVMNYGLQDLKNINPPHIDTPPIYQTEKYDLDYQNFAFSYGYGFNFSTYIFNNSKYSLKCGANLFIEKYKEKLTFTLVDIGNGSEIDYSPLGNKFDSNDAPLGYQQTIVFDSHYGNGNKFWGIGYGVDLILFKKLKNNYSLGLGLFYSQRIRSEFFNGYNSNIYFPIVAPRGLNTYGTKQIGICIELNKTYKRFNGFIKLSQNVLTVKKKEKYGSSEMYTAYSSTPTSQNLDYRFPLIINIGIAVEFDKINKQK